MKSVFALFAAVVFLYSCNKDGDCDTTIVDTYNNDTIQPSAYLGAWPGSWREYDNGYRHECTEWSSIANYSKVLDDEGCLKVAREYLILPIMNGSRIHGDYVLRSDEVNQTSTLSNIVGALGDSWGYSVNFSEGTLDAGHETYSWSVDSLLDFKEVNGVLYEDVLFVRHSYSVYYDHNFGGPPPDITHLYYAKNVGLIQYKYFEYFEYYGEEFPPNEEYGLVDYYIAPH